MSDYYIGEIRLFPFNFAPKDWMPCNGQILAISQYQALFSLLGPTYGGNGSTTFQLPNLNGRANVGMVGTAQNAPFNAVIGAVGGEEAHTLSQQEMPAHSHIAHVAKAATQAAPANALPAATGSPQFATQAAGTFAANEIGTTGGSQPHENMPPFLALNYCIAVNGIFPSRG